MGDAIPPYTISEVWSILGVEDGVVVILAGPFDAASGFREYLAAPVYSGEEEGFVWTDEDVRIEPDEGPFERVQYVAIWNARPVLEADLFNLLGCLTDKAITDVRDVYWASLNEERIDGGERLGKPIRSPKDAAASFQSGELERWRRVSNRVLQVSHTQVNPASWIGETYVGGFSIVRFGFSWGAVEWESGEADTEWLLDAGGVPSYDWILPEPHVVTAEPNSIRTFITATNQFFPAELYRWGTGHDDAYFINVFDEEFSVMSDVRSDAWEPSEKKASAA